MEHPGFFERAAPLRLEALAQMVGAQLGPGADAGALIHDVRGLADAGAGHVTFLDNRRYLGQLATTRAAACLVAPAFAARVPAGRGGAGDGAALPRVRRGPAALLPRRHAAEGGHDAGGRRSAHPSDRPARGGREGRARRHRRPRGPDRPRHDHRRGRARRLSGDHRPRQLRGPRRQRHARADRRPGDPACRGEDRPGRVRLRHGPRAATSRCRRSAA